MNTFVDFIRFVKLALLIIIKERLCICKTN